MKRNGNTALMKLWNNNHFSLSMCPCIAGQIQNTWLAIQIIFVAGDLNECACATSTKQH